MRFFIFLQELAIPHQILHNFCLNDFAAHKHEMDFLFIFLSFILCLEVKNMTGRLDFDIEASQLLRTLADGVIERFPNPVAQLTRHIRFLSSLFPHIPIVGAVVIANCRAIIGSRRNTHILIFHADSLHSFIESSLKRYAKPVLQINIFYEQLLAMQAPMIKPFSFTLTDLKKGVFCEKCSSKMHFVQGRFICSNCHHQDKFAHFQALADFRLLVDSKITNKEFRTLCEISSRYAAKRLLKYLPMIKQGRTAYYKIPEQIVTITSRSPDSTVNSPVNSPHSPILVLIILYIIKKQYTS